MPRKLQPGLRLPLGREWWTRCQLPVPLRSTRRFSSVKLVLGEREPVDRLLEDSEADSFRSGLWRPLPGVLGFDSCRGVRETDREIVTWLRQMMMMLVLSEPPWDSTLATISLAARITSPCSNRRRLRGEGLRGTLRTEGT
jgi:hypothetical protein